MDFVRLAETITFTPQQTSHCVTINLTNDSLVEGAEMFPVTIQNTQGIQAGPDTHVSILDIGSEYLCGCFTHLHCSYVITTNQHLHKPLSLFFIFSLIAVTVGFDPTTYRVNESDGSVAIIIRVLKGMLAKQVNVSFSTENDAAQGKTTCIHVCT